MPRQKEEKNDCLKLVEHLKAWFRRTMNLREVEEMAINFNEGQPADDQEYRTPPQVVGPNWARHNGA